MSAQVYRVAVSSFTLIEVGDAESHNSRRAYGSTYGVETSTQEFIWQSKGPLLHLSSIFIQKVTVVTVLHGHTRTYDICYPPLCDVMHARILLFLLVRVVRIESEPYFSNRIRGKSIPHSCTNLSPDCQPHARRNWREIKGAKSTYLGEFALE